jgi:hypothetical protein
MLNFNLNFTGGYFDKSSLPYGVSNSKIAPGLAYLNTSYLFKKEYWWHATKFALLIKYGASIGFGSKTQMGYCH